MADEISILSRKIGRGRIQMEAMHPNTGHCYGVMNARLSRGKVTIDGNEVVVTSLLVLGFLLREAESWAKARRAVLVEYQLPQGGAVEGSDPLWNNYRRLYCRRGKRNVLQRMVQRPRNRLHQYWKKQPCPWLN